MSEREDKLEKEKDFLLEQIKGGMITNFPINKIQNKYLKKLLYFAIMRAANNNRVAPSKFGRLVNKIFKRFVVKIIKTALPDDYDEEFLEDNLLVELNKILASQELMKSSEFIQEISPLNILGLIKKESENMSAQEMINRVLALRDLKANHRETPEEEKERKERARNLERARARELENIRYRGIERERSRH